MEKKQTVIIIGGNFAGLSAARQLVRLARGSLDITVIDPDGNFNWTPNIHEILSGVKVQSGVSVSRQTMLQNVGVNFIQEGVTVLHRDAKTVTLTSGVTLHYDACIIACGYAPRNNHLPRGHFQFRNAADVHEIRDAINDTDNTRKSINIAIVGGGFTGVEALGELLRKSAYDIKFNITVLERGNSLVKDLCSEISKDIVDLTDTCNVSYKFNCKVLSAHEGGLELSDGSTIASDVTIWSAGGSAPQFLLDSGFVNGNNGAIKVNTYLQAEVCPDCFVAGDIAHVTQPGFARRLAKQSYHAIDMGKTAAQNVANHLLSAPLQQFQPNPKPILLAFGDLNTYLISGDSVFASPLFAATKEALYQVSMHKLMSAESLYQRKRSFFERLLRSANRLLLPELQPATLHNVVARSRVLKKGSKEDLIPLIKGARSTLFDAF